MEYKRRDFIADGGERFSILADENRLPDFWTTLYLTTHLRSMKHETARSYLNHFVHFKVWEASVGESISDRILRRYKESISDWGFSIPVFMTVAEAQALARHCKVTTQVARRALIVPKNKNVISLQSVLPASRAPEPTVSVQLERNRLTVLANYIEFVAQNILRKGEHYGDCIKPIESMKALILSQKPSSQGLSQSDFDPDLKAPPPEVFDEVMRLVQPACPDNPFTALVRNRNSLIFRVMHETGMRSGEVLQIKIPDIEFSGEKIKVRRRHDDPEDTYRAVEPNAKTLGRDLPISKSLTDDLREYIVRERSKIKEAGKHSFLFVAYKGVTKGAPISLNQFAKLVNKVSKDKNLIAYMASIGMTDARSLHRHGFRHNYNNWLSECIDTKNQTAREEGRLNEIVTEAREIDIRMHLNGHKREKSSRIYNIRHTKKGAEEIVRPELNKIDHYIKKGRNNDSTSD